MVVAVCVQVQFLFRPSIISSASFPHHQRRRGRIDHSIAQFNGENSNITLIAFEFDAQRKTTRFIRDEGTPGIVLRPSPHNFLDSSTARKMYLIFQ
jgi:hypothetical protein